MRDSTRDMCIYCRIGFHGIFKGYGTFNYISMTYYTLYMALLVSNNHQHDQDHHHRISVNLKDENVT